MKSNKAPEKLYLQVCGNCTLNDKETCEQCYKDNPINNGRDVTWCVDKIFDNDVEYTRTDAFIEKATEWLKKNVTYTHPRKGTEECVVNLNAFREAMKGE